MDVRLEDILSENLELFRGQKLNCAEAVLCSMMQFWGEDGDFAPRIATAFGGGICGRQGLCGALTGGLMAIGLKLGRRQPGDDKAPANQAGKAFLTWAGDSLPSLECRALTGVDFSDAAENARFRAPDGPHEKVCERLVAQVVRRLAETL
jgi:C_GCAxxG_C_C family probable redox protein